MLLVGLFGAQGFKKGDVLYSLDGRAVSDYGEVWCGSSGVSRNVFDVLSSVDWGGSVVVSVLRVGGECVDVDFRYSELRGSALGELRLLDSVLDASVLVKEVLGIKGVTMKPLRLNDVVNYRMANYMETSMPTNFASWWQILIVTRLPIMPKLFAPVIYCTW